jgi:hypothetical protein
MRRGGEDRIERWICGLLGALAVFEDELPALSWVAKRKGFMDRRIARIRRKLACIPYLGHRSHSFGEEKHQFRRGPTLTSRQLAEFEQHLAVGLPEGYRDFLCHVEGHGAAPFYGIMPWARCGLFAMNPRGDQPAGRGFTAAGAVHRSGDLFLHIIEAGCSDLVLMGVTGPLAGQIVIGNGEGFWGPDLSQAPDFLAWYERWLDAVAAQRDDRKPHLTSPGIAKVNRIGRGRAGLHGPGAERVSRPGAAP